MAANYDTNPYLDAYVRNFPTWMIRNVLHARQPETPDEEAGWQALVRELGRRRTPGRTQATDDA